MSAKGLDRASAEHQTRARTKDPALDDILARYLDGKLSAPVALMQLLIETENADAVRAVVTDFSRDAAEAVDGAAA